MIIVCLFKVPNPRVQRLSEICPRICRIIRALASAFVILRQLLLGDEADFPEASESGFTLSPELFNLLARALHPNPLLTITMDEIATPSRVILG